MGDIVVITVIGFHVLSAGHRPPLTRFLATFQFPDRNLSGDNLGTEIQERSSAKTKARSSNSLFS